MDPPRDPEELGEGSVLDPEDLDITDEEEVEELDETRFVIGAEGRPHDGAGDSSGSQPDSRTDSPTSVFEDTDPTTNDRSVQEEATDQRTQPSGAGAGTGTGRSETPSQVELRGSDVKRWISANLQRTDSQYAYRLAAKTGDEISHQQLASDDIGMAFDGLLMWYAQQVGDGTAVEDTLGILLAESNIRVRFPVVGMAAYLEQHDLSPEDSIGELLAVIREHDGIVFPRGTNR